jgi:hypothetical protein
MLEAHTHRNTTFEVQLEQTDHNLVSELSGFTQLPTWFADVPATFVRSGPGYVITGPRARSAT